MIPTAGANEAANDKYQRALLDSGCNGAMLVLKDANGREYWEFPCLAPRRLLVKTEEGSWGTYHQPEARAELLAYLDEQRGCLGDGALDAAVAAVRDGLKLSGLLVSVLHATPAAAPEDGAEREPEALAVLAAATVPLAALLEPSFAAGSALVETAALAFESGEDADDASVTVAVRLNPEDE